MSLPFKTLFIFDLDGTLADVYQAIFKSLNFTLKKFNKKPVSFDQVKRTVGKGDRLFIELFFEPEIVDKALRIYRKHHRQAVIDYSRLKPQALTLLKQLRKRLKITALATNRPLIFTKKIIRHLKIEKYLDAVLCADTINALKPDPKMLLTLMNRFKVDPKKTVYIGDMEIDLQTAANAGCDAVFIKGGSGTVSQAKKYKRVKIIDSLSEVLLIYG